MELKRSYEPVSGGRIAYTEDFYRIDGEIRAWNLEHLKNLPPFEILIIKSRKSRQLTVCPEREYEGPVLTKEAVDFLGTVGINTVITDAGELEYTEGNIRIIQTGTLYGVLPGYYTCKEVDGKILIGNVERGFLPLGVRRDGSLYSRIQWASTTEKNPYYWVCNLIDDDVERHGGTWGANTMGPANAILDFFGEEQTIGTVRIFHNVGSTISIEEEMAEHIRLYISNDEQCSRFGREDEEIDIVSWEKILDVHMEMKEKWNTYFLERPVKARYLRIELVKNFGTPEDVPWTETAELKVFPVL
ncbi:hypothetical protein V3C10_14050 [[Clostridium] symbiosum]|uniref:hypothetical protein n=1 Tax=Clostridium symbiosum TaxID=1512 RepID=UPI001D08A898|nr:hypothetical protein [[Clostridium] symbiosum]MCB6608292.1 hypothetical protein [[Clostridium] symbiosum]MCB6932842.1 hypothetical protein [[Clostridium] symbiosum]